VRTLSSSTVFRFGEDFGRIRISLSTRVERERKLLECRACGLWYFNMVPSRSVLEEVIWPACDTVRWSGDERPGQTAARLHLSAKPPALRTALDIGSHNGAFLAGLGAGWARYALDPAAPTDAGQSGDVVHLPMYAEDLDITPGSVGVATAFDLLEHLQEPSKAIRKVSAALAPGGYVIAETGDAGCFFARLLRAGWYYLSYLEHFQAFTSNALTALFESNGLKVERLTRTRHDRATVLPWLQAAAPTSIYATLTMGGRPNLWRFLNRTFRSRHNASPVPTGRLEKDHIFLIARKP
jgi:hypothetical protein